MNAVEIANLQKNFGRKQAVQGLNMTVPEGEADQQNEGTQVRHQKPEQPSGPAVSAKAPQIQESEERTSKLLPARCY